MSTLPPSIPESAYGSDEHGLIWGYLVLPGQRPSAIECGIAQRYLSSRAQHGIDEAEATGFVWLHFSLASPRAERWMRQNLGLPGTFYDSLHVSVGSTRLEVEDEGLIAVIHDVILNSTFDASNISTLTMCLGPRLVVSARLRPLRSVDRLREALKEGHHNLRSSAELLGHLLRDQANVLADVVRQSTSRVDVIEDKLLGNRISVTRAELSAMRRALVRLQRLLAPEPAAIFRLLSRPPPWLNEEDVTDLRQAAEEFSAAVVDSAALAERLKLLQEELVAMVGEHTNRTLFILTLVTVIALPINVVAGLLGMNVGGIPLAAHPRGFTIVVGILMVLTIGLVYFFLLRRRE